MRGKMSAATKAKISAAMRNRVKSALPTIQESAHNRILVLALVDKLKQEVREGHKHGAKVTARLIARCRW